MAKGAGLEGLIAKRLTSRYEPGARSKTWVKIKAHRIADVVIGGWVPGRGRLAGLPGAVLVGEWHDGLLHYAGSVGTGWSHTQRTRLAGLLQAAATDTCPFVQVAELVHQVGAELVGGLVSGGVHTGVPGWMRVDRRAS